MTALLGNQSTTDMAFSFYQIKAASGDFFFERERENIQNKD